MVPMDKSDDAMAGLFAQCSFAVVRSATLGDDEAEKLSVMIRLHGGSAVIDQYNEQNLSLDGITHVVSSTFDFPDYNNACDALIPVLRPLWIEHSLAKNRLAHTRQYSPDPRLFMSEVVACCADLPEADADAIAGGILAMGGLYTSRLSGQVTHIVALTTEAEICVIAQSKNLNIKVVLPHWFDDCVKLGRKIDEQPYLLPDPEILQHTNNKAPGGGQSGHITGAIHPDPSPSLPSPAHRRQKIFQNKNVMLANDLGIRDHLRGTLEDIIIEAGGKVTTSVRKADMFICKYRDGQDYKVASRAGKHVGNLGWLYYLITTDTWTSPFRRLLHYPVARKGLPGFSNFRISLSNYSGEARTYLENLIIATGAKCTKTLKQDNTHLITAHVMSEKCAAAKDWGIHLVNHLWLEESYAKWNLQGVTASRYVHFPARTNLGEVVGQTPIDRAVLERHFFADEDDDDIEMTEAPDMPTPMQPKDHNIKSGSKLSKAVNGQAVEVAEKHRTPATPRHVALGKENETPSTTHSRKSKDAAAAKLHQMTPDIALYEKEKKRVGGVVYGGRRKGDADRVTGTRKRSIDEASDSDATEENETKRPKKDLPHSTVNLLISGYKKWIGHSKLEDADKKHLRGLGINVTLDPAKATHLAVPHILRTHKFVTALAYAPQIISTAFIDECLEQDEFLDPDSFRLNDKDNEKKLGVSLQLSRERAKENRNQLLHGRSIYCVENIHGGFEVLRSIIEANGGQCMMYRGRPGTMVPSRRATSETSVDEMENEVYLLSGPGKDQSRVWPRFMKMAEGSRHVPRIVHSDWLLETAMCQKIQPVEKYELHESG